MTPADKTLNISIGVGICLFLAIFGVCWFFADAKPHSLVTHSSPTVAYEGFPENIESFGWFETSSAPSVKLHGTEDYGWDDVANTTEYEIIVCPGCGECGPFTVDSCTCLPEPIKGTHTWIDETGVWYFDDLNVASPTICELICHKCGFEFSKEF